MAEVNGSRWSMFWRLVTRYEGDKIAPWIALRNAIGIVLSLAGAAAAGSPAAGLIMATGALNVSFSDSDDPYVKRAGRMLAASVLVGLAVYFGALCAGAPRLAVSLITVWAFAAGMLVAIHATAADLGLITLATLVVFSAEGRPPGNPAASGVLAMSGALLQTGLALALWPLRRYEPERRVLGNLYLELSHLAGSPRPATATPAGSAESALAHETLATLGRDHSIQGERYRSLLNQAERARLGLLALARLRARLERENDGDRSRQVLARYFEVSSGVLKSIGNSLRASSASVIPAEPLAELSSLAESLREMGMKEPTASAALVRDARIQADAVAGQLRWAADLALNAAPDGNAAFERREAMRARGLRLAGVAATLRANVNLQSAAFRHALRLGVCVGAADALARGAGLGRSYWLAMTVAIVLKPDFTATFSRGVLRVAGTFIGLALATAIFELMPPLIWLEIALVGIAVFIMRCFGPANYGIFVTALTALVVLLFALSGVSPQQVILSRGLNTMIGGGIALIAYALWPTWERTQAPEAMARMLDAYRLYFRAIREAYLAPSQSMEAELERTRVAARLARSNLEASFDRVSAEPGTPEEQAGALAAMLASSHRLVHAFMALEAGLAESRPVPPRPPFRNFADQVELTLYFLAAALRGSGTTREELPDLREAHHALVHSPAPAAERYALVNTETDRITNSLNTLSEQILDWSGRRP
jgi:uncharacterized membrane protein YccC